MEDADDPCRALVAGQLEAELLDEARVGRGPGHGCGTGVRDVREERPERDDELDVELPRESGDELGERPPAVARLDPCEQDHVTIGPRDRGVLESVLGPLDVAGEPFVEDDGRAGRLEVHEAFGIDLREGRRLPDLLEVLDRHRRALAAVVPAGERTDEHRPAQRRQLGDP